VPVSAIILASVGGMLLFMGLFFLMVAGLGVGGFLIPSLAVIAVAVIMMLVAWNIWRKIRVRHEERQQEEKERLDCDYCGGMNAEGDLQCRFCGAPLR
jgi:membrane protein implicated in regulation of membrane protease activity